jgi:4-hydroxybenzoate polyprenyltransferase/phosphoserine phosphatase
MNQPNPAVALRAQTIVIDLDGTLVLTDTLHESAMQLLRDNALQAFNLPVWLSRGKAQLKQKLAQAVSLNPQTLPYNAPLLEWILQKKLEGNRLVLCTAADQSIANSVANHLQCFDEVIASDGHNNLAGEAKKAALDSAFGPNQYLYVGNSSDDLHVWQGASSAVVVNANKRVLAQAQQITKVQQHFPSPKVGLSVWRKVFRVHQWLKNALLFVPLMAAHQVTDTHAIGMLMLAFLSFSLCASSVYITNDLMDLESDRQHPRKRSRPFASGLVPISTGVVLAPICLALSMAVATQVNQAFTNWLIVYFALTFAYSVKLKKMVLVDCLTLAALYTLRVIAGAAVVSIELSFWLLAFSIFIFLSLAFVKRYAELQVQSTEGKQKAHGRGYYVDDVSIVQTMGVSAGNAAVMVLALYLNGETAASLYHTPKIIWGAIPLMLFWISWVWLKAHRGEMNDDPLVFAVKDKVSWVVMLGIATSFIAATFVI